MSTDLKAEAKGCFITGSIAAFLGISIILGSHYFTQNYGAKSEESNLPKKVNSQKKISLKNQSYNHSR